MKITRELIGIGIIGMIFIGCNKTPLLQSNTKEVSISQVNQNMAIIPKEQVNNQCKTTVIKAMKLSNRVKYLTNTLIKCHSSNKNSLFCKPLRSELCQKKEALQYFGKKLKFDCKGSELENEANILGSNFFEVSNSLEECY